MTINDQIRAIHKFAKEVLIEDVTVRMRMDMFCPPYSEIGAMGGELPTSTQQPTTLSWLDQCGCPDVPRWHAEVHPAGTYKNGHKAWLSCHAYMPTPESALDALMEYLVGVKRAHDKADEIVESNRLSAESKKRDEKNNAVIAYGKAQGWK